MAPEADAFTYATIASHEGVVVEAADLSGANAIEYRKYGIVELLDDRHAGVAVSAEPSA